MLVRLEADEYHDWHTDNLNRNCGSSVVIGVVYYILQLRHQSKNRDLQMVINLGSTLERFEFQEAMSRITALKIDDPLEIEKAISLPVLLTVSNYFERVGVMVNRELLSPEMVHDLLPPVTILWRRIRHWIVFFRTRENDPRLFTWFEYLNNEIGKREEKHNKV